MVVYRIYLLNAMLGFSGPGLTALCQDDEAARHFAQMFFLRGCYVEIWAGSRLVGRVETPCGPDFWVKSSTQNEAVRHPSEAVTEAVCRLDASFLKLQRSFDEIEAIATGGGGDVHPGRAKMDYFRVVGDSPHTSEPMEKVVSTAVEAEIQSSAFRRLCGKSGKVEVWGKNGRLISPDLLNSMARDERVAR